MPRHHCPAHLFDFVQQFLFAGSVEPFALAIALIESLTGLASVQRRAFAAPENMSLMMGLSPTPDKRTLPEGNLLVSPWTVQSNWCYLPVRI
jgi:hypothetical protein